MLLVAVHGRRRLGIEITPALAAHAALYEVFQNRSAYPSAGRCRGSVDENWQNGFRHMVKHLALGQEHQISSDIGNP